jgi:hypothetical protein
MTPIADIVKYIDCKNKSIPGHDDFAGYTHDALVFDNTGARELVGLLVQAPWKQELENAVKLQQLLRDKFVSEYGEKTEAWLHEHEQPFSKAVGEV